MWTNDFRTEKRCHLYSISLNKVNCDAPPSVRFGFTEFLFLPRAELAITPGLNSSLLPRTQQNESTNSGVASNSGSSSSALAAATSTSGNAPLSPTGKWRDKLLPPPSHWISSAILSFNFSGGSCACTYQERQRRKWRRRQRQRELRDERDQLKCHGKLWHRRGGGREH